MKQKWSTLNNIKALKYIGSNFSSGFIQVQTEMIYVPVFPIVRFIQTAGLPGDLFSTHKIF